MCYFQIIIYSEFLLQVQYDYNLPNNADETFTLQYGLQISYQVEVTFEASQFDDYPNRGFLFKVEGKYLFFILSA